MANNTNENVALSHFLSAQVFALGVARSKILHAYAVVSVEMLDGLVDRIAVWLQSFTHRTEKYGLHRLMLLCQDSGCQIGVECEA